MKIPILIKFCVGIKMQKLNLLPTLPGAGVIVILGGGGGGGGGAGPDS